MSELSFALLRYGESRAAEMRERVAEFMTKLAHATFDGTDSSDTAQRDAVLALAGMIRQLPLTPKPAGGGGERG